MARRMSRKEKAQARLEAEQAEWKPEHFRPLAGLTLICGLLVVVAGWRDVKGSLFMDASSFHTTQGTITSSHTKSCGRSRASTCFEIVYQYHVDSINIMLIRFVMNPVKSIFQ